MKNEFQKLVDRELSGLCWDERMRQRVLHSLQKEEKPVKRKMTAAMALVLVLVLIGSIALATGLIFSPRYNALKLADEALLSAYGITDEMMTFFSRTLNKENGATMVTYCGIEELRSVLGVYEVKVDNSRVTAKWSLDGVDGGWDASKLAKINALCKQDGDCGKAIEQAIADAERYQLTGYDSGIRFSEKETQQMMEKRSQEAEAAMKAAVLTTHEMDAIARQTLQERFALTQHQLEQLELVEESCDWFVREDQKLFSLYYWLRQCEDNWTEADGIYIVDVNVETGAVEEAHYDTGLFGKG
ncbi:MAG: hypothetical protein PUD63_11555 [Clostridia bacterium]|nr:hypothetical protein [Clostridia bacterium]